MKKAEIQARAVSVDAVSFDLDNFRIGHQDSQAEAIAALIHDQEKKIVKLARDIVTYGLSPLENFALVPASEARTNRNFVSLDGNRRLLALKLLRNPELAKSTEIFEPIRKLGGKAKGRVPDTISGVILSREEAYQWIRRKHDIGLGGAGLEPWGYEAKLRFAQWMGKHSPALSIIDTVRARSDLTPEEADLLTDVPLTTVERVVLGDYFKSSLGIDYVDGKVVGDRDRDSVERVWKRMVLDFASGDKTVNNVRTPPQREKYINSLIKAELGKPPAASPKWEIGSGGASTPSRKKAPASRGKLQTTRLTVAPSRHGLNVDDSKVSAALKELTLLRVEKHELACGLLLRLFLELTCIHYQKKRGIGAWSTQIELGKRLTAVLDHMQSNQVATDKELKGARNAASNQHDIASTDTLNAYTHSVYFVPKPRDLLRTWEQLLPFFSKVWT